MRKFMGLSGYFGGKRKIVPYIFKYAPKPTKEQDLTFLDPFMGGGSVSYYAKHLGYRVISGDISYRSSIIGKALIENNTKKLPDWKIFLEPNDNTWLQDHYGDYFYKDIAELYDTVRGNIKRRGDKPLELYLYLKMLLYIVPFNMLMHKVPKEIYEKDKAAQLRELAKHKIYAKYIKYLIDPPELLRQMHSHINKAIINNNQQNTFYKGDVFDFISRYGDKGDILYLDPPYPGTLGYDELQWADRMVLQDNNFKEEFGEEWTNPNTFPQVFSKLLEETRDIPNLIISIGNYDHNKLLSIVRQYRPRAKMFSIKHKWLEALIKKEKGDELLIIDIKPG